MGFEYEESMYQLMQTFTGIYMLRCFTSGMNNQNIIFFTIILRSLTENIMESWGKFLKLNSF